MPFLKMPPQPIASVLTLHLLAELGWTCASGDPGDVTAVRGHGMPADTVVLAQPDVALSVTCRDAPVFRDKVAELAAAQSRDVVLMRCCRTSDIFPVGVDITLGGHGLDPFSLYDLSLYRHGDGVLWLVPEYHGPSVRITTTGLELEFCAPYDTFAERLAGVLRAATQLAVEMFPKEVR